VVQCLRLAVSKRRNRVSPSPHLRTEIDAVGFSSISNSGRCTKSINPVILSVIHNRQTSLDSNCNVYNNLSNPSILLQSYEGLLVSGLLEYSTAQWNSACWTETVEYMSADP
jgi:hypothetical protein